MQRFKSIKRTILRKSDVSDSVIDLIDKGLGYQDVRDILRLDEETLREFCKQYTQVKIGFKNELSSLKLHVHYRKIKKLILNEIVTQNMYSIVLLFLSWVMIFTLKYVLSPIIFDYLESFEVTTSTAIGLINIAFTFVLIELSVLLLFGVLLKFKKSSTLFMMRVVVFNLPFIKNFRRTFNSNIFGYIYLLGTEESTSPKDILNISRKSTCSAEVKNYAFQIEKGIEEGFSFEESLVHSDIDHDFIRFLKLGIRTADIEQCLKQYLLLSEVRLSLFTKKCKKSLQLFSYSQVILVVILYYFVLYQTIKIMEAIF